MADFLAVQAFQMQSALQTSGSAQCCRGGIDSTFTPGINAGAFRRVRGQDIGNSMAKTWVTVLSSPRDGRGLRKNIITTWVDEGAV